MVTVVPAVDPSVIVGGGHSGPTMSPDQKQQLVDAQRSEGEAVLAATSELIPSADPERLLLHGDPGQEICRAAEDLDADVVVIGTRGHGGLRRAVLGSVSDHVIRNAPCPVLTVSGSD